MASVPTVEPLIFTFFIYTHGSVRNLELSAEHNTVFERCRLFSETAHNLGITCSEPNEEYMKEQIRKDIYGPMYNFLTKRGAELMIQPMASITFDKMLGATYREINGVFPIEIDRFFNIERYGIYLLSVHRKTSSGLNVFYELPYWNLLKIDDLTAFAEHFGRGFRRPGSEQILLPTNLTGFTEWSGVELDLTSKYIVHIKMSKFVEIIKSIVGENAYFNLLDFSCSVDRAETQVYPWHTQIADAENMEGVEVWGGMKRNPRVERNPRGKKRPIRTKRRRNHMRNKQKNKITKYKNKL